MYFKNGVFWDVTLCGSCKNEFSEELSASNIRLTKIGELGTTLSLNISSQCASVADDGGAKLLRNVGSYNSHTA
jgi:hypothetical protein